MSCRNAARLHWAMSSWSSAAIRPGDVGALHQVLEHVLPVRGPVAQGAQDRDQRGVQVGDAHLGHGVLGGPQAQGLDLARLRSCTSSIRAGWIRPSLTSSVKVIRAVSRRTGSKQDSSTDSGVSSIITLTPVTCSKARMLRPSRPMIRPFMSSPGRCTADTTDSEVCSEATRWMAPTTIIWARALASRDGLTLDVAGDQHRLPLGVVLDRGHELGLGLLGRQPGEPLEDLLLLGLALGQGAAAGPSAGS